MKKVKKPRPPRCLCNSVLDWAFGIVSPSKYYFYTGKTNREREQVELYFAQMRAYQEYIWLQRVAARSVTKEEWRQHYRQQRIKERQQLARSNAHNLHKHARYAAKMQSIV